jgi:hypothetical protein
MYSIGFLDLAKDVPNDCDYSYMCVVGICTKPLLSIGFDRHSFVPRYPIDVLNLLRCLTPPEVVVLRNLVEEAKENRENPMVNPRISIAQVWTSMGIREEVYRPT